MRTPRRSLADAGVAGTIPSAGGWELPPGLRILQLKHNNISGEGHVRTAGAAGPTCSRSGRLWQPGLCPLAGGWRCGLRTTGTIPANWTLPPGLEMLSWNGNQLSGALPPGMLPSGLQVRCGSRGRDWLLGAGGAQLHEAILLSPWLCSGAGNAVAGFQSSPKFALVTPPLLHVLTPLCSCFILRITGWQGPCHPGCPPT